MKVMVVIPIFNEGKNVRKLVEGVAEFEEIDKVVVVDDGSRLKSGIRDSKKVAVLEHMVNLGKGSAMKTGAVWAFSNGASHVIFMDGDGQHKISELPKFLKYIKKDIDLVLGVRRVGHKQPLIRSLGNRFASSYISLMFGHKFNDILSGYRSMSHRAFVLMQWESQRYGVETEIAARFGTTGGVLSKKEVPIGTFYDDKYKGVTIIDAFNILFETIWWRLTWGYN